MAFKFSLDAQEFVPSFNRQQTSKIGDRQMFVERRPSHQAQPTNLQNSLAYFVDAPIFVPSNPESYHQLSTTATENFLETASVQFSCETPSSIAQGRRSGARKREENNWQARTARRNILDIKQDGDVQHQRKFQKADTYFRDKKTSNSRAKEENFSVRNQDLQNADSAPRTAKPRQDGYFPNRTTNSNIPHSSRTSMTNPKSYETLSELTYQQYGEPKRNKYQKDATKTNECDSVKSWRDVVKARPTDPAKRVDNNDESCREYKDNNVKDQSIQRNEANRFHGRKSGQMTQNTGRFVDSRTGIRMTVGRASSNSYTEQNPSRYQKTRESLNEQLPEWRQKSQNSVSTYKQRQSQDGSFTKTSGSFYRDRNRKLKCFELERVPAHFANTVKRKLFQKSYQEPEEAIRSRRKPARTFRGWYGLENVSGCDDQCLKDKANRDVAVRDHMDKSGSHEIKQTDSLSPVARNCSSKIENNNVSVYTARMPYSKVANKQLRQNVERASYSKVVDQKKRGSEDKKVTLAEKEATKDRKYQEGIPGKQEGAGFETSRRYRKEDPEELVFSEQGPGDDADEWTDEEGWVTVGDRSRQKKQKSLERVLANASSNSDSTATGIKASGSISRDAGSKNTSESISDRSTKNKGAKVKKKKPNKRKKTKQKETVLYENDEKKIREFKMMQMIEENLKQNLLELTRTRKKLFTNETVDDKDSNEENDWPSIGMAEPVRKPVMSYMDALIKSAPAPRPAVNNLAAARPKSTLTAEERQELRRAKLKEKRKLKKKERKQRKREEAQDNDDDPSMQTVSMLSKQNITLDLGSMFDKLIQSPEKERSTPSLNQKKTKRNIVSTGVVSVVSGLAKKKSESWKNDQNKTKVSFNALDSTQPARMRGKERETPKKKKLTLLKRVIMREREAKKRQREVEKLKDNGEDEEALTENKQDVDEKTVVVRLDEDADNSLDPLEESPEERNRMDKNNKMARSDEETPQKSDCPTASKQFSEVPEEILKKLHSRKFREYCDHFLSKDIDDLVQKILKDLLRFQTRAFIDNPIKAKAKRRFALGLREVYKHVKMKRLKCVIMAPNLEKISAEGGIDDILGNIISECKKLSLMIVYAKSRQALGMTLNRKVPVSAIGIFNYDGTEDNFNMMKTLVEEQRDKYRLKVAELLSSLEDLAI